MRSPGLVLPPESLPEAQRRYLYGDVDPAHPPGAGSESRALAAIVGRHALLVLPAFGEHREDGVADQQVGDDPDPQEGDRQRERDPEGAVRMAKTEEVSGDQEHGVDHTRAPDGGTSARLPSR